MLAHGYTVEAGLLRRLGLQHEFRNGVRRRQAMDVQTGRD
jgi:hypothetical protein